MKRILLIEPNIALAQVYTRMLTKHGLAVTHVKGAQAAINAVDKDKPDVVILELQLARHSGVEFLHEFRSYPEWLHIPVVVNTSVLPAHLTDLLGPLQAELGVCAVLYKPKTSLQILLGVVQEQLATT